MKKTLKVFALTALAFTMIFTSCKKDVKPNIDVVQVEASKITVEAYPCENRIFWTPVSNADYALYKNGERVDDRYIKDFSCVDTNIVDGVEYEYKIITTPKADFEIKNEFGDQVTALGGSNKTAYYTKGNSASAKVTAIVPATTITSKDGVTTAITAVDLIDFDKKAKKTSKVTADNFVFDLKDNYFYYSFPMVDYLDYYVSCYRGNEKDYILFEDAVEDTIQSYYKGKSELITEPGDYTLVLEVSKAGYADTVIEAKTPITVKTLDVATATGTPKVEYIDGGKTARIWWTPAKKADGSVWAPANYNVYSVDRNNNYTSVLSDTVKVNVLDVDREWKWNDSYGYSEEFLKTNTVYYVDYALPEGEDNLIKNFCVVLSSEDGIEKGKKTCKLESANIEIAEGKGTGKPTAKYIDEDTACIYWTPAKNNDGKDWPAANYTLYTIDETGFWTKVDLPKETTIKTEIIDGTEYYCVNLPIADTTKKYKFGVQLSDGAKKEEGKTVELSADPIDVATPTTGLNVAYVPNSDVARVWWTPATNENGDNWPAANYNVYSIDENGFWTKKETVDIKSAIRSDEDKDGDPVGKEVYYVEFNIEDTTKEYNFGIELADGDKKETRLQTTRPLAAKVLEFATRTGNPSAEYISEDTVRIWWTPATKKSDESELAPTNYTVYVKDENGFLDTITDIEVKEDSKVGDVVYYLEYTVEDNEEAYTFEVVLTINGDYVDIKEEEVKAKKSTETTVFDAENNAKVNFTSLDNADLFANDAVLSITLAKDEKVDFVKYKVLNKSDDFIFPAEALLDSAFVELTVAEEYYGANKFIVKDLKEGDRIVFLYSIVEEDKEPICEITSINVVDTSDVVDTFKDAINDLNDLNDPITILDAYDQADDKKSNVTVSFDLSTSSLKYKDNWKVQIFYAKLANDDNSVKWNEIKVPDFEENAAKDLYVAKIEKVLEIDTKVDFNPFDGDFARYKDTYAIKYVYTCEGISEPIEEVFTKTFEKERQ